MNIKTFIQGLFHKPKICTAKEQERLCIFLFSSQELELHVAQGDLKEHWTRQILILRSPCFPFKHGLVEEKGEQIAISLNRILPTLVHFLEIQSPLPPFYLIKFIDLSSNSQHRKISKNSIFLILQSISSSLSMYCLEALKVLKIFN